MELCRQEKDRKEIRSFHETEQLFHFGAGLQILLTFTMQCLSPSENLHSNNEMCLQHCVETENCQHQRVRHEQLEEANGVLHGCIVQCRPHHFPSVPRLLSTRPTPLVLTHPSPHSCLNSHGNYTHQWFSFQNTVTVM